MKNDAQYSLGSISTQSLPFQQAYKVCWGKGKSVYGTSCRALTAPLPSSSVSTALEPVTTSLTCTNQSSEAPVGRNLQIRQQACERLISDKFLVESMSLGGVQTRCDVSGLVNLIGKESLTFV